MFRYKNLFYLIFLLIGCSSDMLICDINNPNRCACEKFTSDATNFVTTKIDCSFKGFESLELIDVPVHTEELDLSFNHFENFARLKINHPDGLQSLFLNRNKIGTIEEDAFIDLENLVELDLSGNSITRLNINTFDGLNNLRILNLAVNGLTNFNRDTFHPVPSLKTLILDYNNLGKFIEKTPNFFKHADITLSIEEISLKGTNISVLPKDLFQQMDYLERLNLAENDLEVLPRLPSTLQSLDISSCKFRNLSHNLVLPSLTHLYMNDMQDILSIEDDDFKDLKSLKFLQAKNCKQLTVISSHMFGKSVNVPPNLPIHEINLLGSGLSTLDESLHKIFSKTYILNLQGLPLHCECKMKWILDLDIHENDREFIRCKTPEHLADMELFSLNEEELCKPWPKDTKTLTTIALAVLSICLIGLALWLVFLYDPFKFISAPIHAMPYNHIHIQPNNAEL